VQIVLVRAGLVAESFGAYDWHGAAAGNVVAAAAATVPQQRCVWCDAGAYCTTALPTRGLEQ
jgi:hypothetical protein